MKTFQDNAGRTWTISVHVTAIKRVRTMLGVDLYGLLDNKFAGLGKLLGDPVDLVDVLYVLCKDECDARSVTDEEFGRSMAGDAIHHASEAFVAEFTDFFPDPGVRAGLKRMMAATRTVADRMTAHLHAQIDAIDPDSVANKWIASSGDSPGSSESTPVP